MMALVNEGADVKKHDVRMRERNMDEGNNRSCQTCHEKKNGVGNGDISSLIDNEQIIVHSFLLPPLLLLPFSSLLFFPVSSLLSLTHTLPTHAGTGMNCGWLFANMMPPGTDGSGDGVRFQRDCSVFGES